MIIDLRLQKRGSPPLAELNHVLADDTRSQFELSHGRLRVHISLELSGTLVSVIARPHELADTSIRWSAYISPHPKKWQGLTERHNQLNEHWTCFVRCVRDDAHLPAPTP